MNKKIIVIFIVSTLFSNQQYLYSNNTTQISQQINPNLQTIMSKLEDLDEIYQPANIKKAMTLMLQGKSVWKNISQNKLYTALDLKIDDPQTVLIIKNSLEKSPDAFWIEIHNNPKVQQTIEQANISFTRETSSSPEYYMLFRMSYLKTLITDDKIILKIQKSYQDAIIALQWFLYAQALLENDKFLSAMVVIPDQNLSLFYFLDGYAELIAPRYRLYSALSMHSLCQPNARTQITRHWKHKKLFKDSAFGISFLNEDKKPEFILPLNNAHIVFGTLENHMTFIKWQKKGLHSIDIKNKKNLEPHYLRSDKIPKDVLLQFKSLFGHQLTRHQSFLVNKDGISAMIQMLDPESRPLFTTFLKKIKKYNPIDNNLRKGNEIILNPHRFKDFQTI